MAYETSSYDVSDLTEISWNVPIESTRISEYPETFHSSFKEASSSERKRKESRKSVRIDEDCVIIYPDNSNEQPTIPQTASLPVKSLESRDNPFLPGGQLEQETDDLLKHSTIIRDQFILDGEEADEMLESGSGNNVTSPNKNATIVVEGEIKPVEAKSNEASAQEKVKENGKVDDKTPTDGINADISKQQIDGDAVRENNKEKNKQKKCCSIM